MADPAEAREEMDPAAAAACMTCGGGGEGEWLCPRSRCNGGTTLAAAAEGIVSRCRRAAS